MKVNVLEIAQKIKEGDKSALSKTITWAESSKPQHRLLSQKILQSLSTDTPPSTVRIGITGVPGAGKSTFIESFGLYLISQGHKVAVLSIDPSSHISKGSILGDKTRMEQLSHHEQAYIRPSSSGLTLGGLHHYTFDAIQLCEAAGYDVVIIETVGVGQNEVEVSQVCDFFLFLAISGAGDELQGLKRGIMEMCHGIVINKSDGDNVPATQVAQTQIRHALNFLPKNEWGWKVPVMLVSSLFQTGIELVWQKIQDFLNLLKSQDSLQEVRQRQKLHLFKKELEQQVWENFVSQHKELIEIFEKKLMKGEESIFTAINSITHSTLK